MALYAPAVLASVFVTLCVLLYRAILPKPLPGIPYERKSATRILGDVPDALKHYAETSEMISFLATKCQKLNSPIIQVFMRPLRQPWVVLADGQESLDIMSHRTREFDRSRFFADMFVSIIPDYVGMPTNDQWRANRRLVSDAMSPRFLGDVAAVQVHRSALGLIKLWKHKQRLSRGFAFDVQYDIPMCTLDTIWAATFGEDIGACERQINHLASLDSIELPSASESLIKIPSVPAPETYTALKTVAQSSQIALHSPLGRYHHWFAINFFPTLRRALTLQKRLVRKSIKEAWIKRGVGEKSGAPTIRSAADLIIGNEADLARKGGRTPTYDSRTVHDELSGFLEAGLDTISTVVSWGLKYLSKYKDVQTRLRTELELCFSDDRQEHDQPTAQMISEAHLPYLEAFINEVLRCSGTVSAIARLAVVDTEVLGHRIPKGTEVFMLTSGPGFHSPAFEVDVSKRSKSSREIKDRRSWNNTNLDKFNPDRWLVTKENGIIECDSAAAPMRSFGAGLRACFGKKLAYLELRIIFALLIWNFDIQPPPESLLDFKAADVIMHKPQNVYIRLGYLD